MFQPSPSHHTHHPLPLLHPSTLRSVAAYLKRASSTCSARFDPDPVLPGVRAHARAFVRTVPCLSLLLQLLWSGTITIASYFLANARLSSLSHSPDGLLPSSFSRHFWADNFTNVPASLSFGVGWALFLLLSFFVAEASRHHREGLFGLARLSFTLRRVARHLRHNYPRGTWHPGDHARIVAHLVAYPLCVSRPLDPTALAALLHPRDVGDIRASPNPHYHCLSVVRSYFIATEPDAPQFHVTTTPTDTSPAGMTTRNAASILIDDVDAVANCLHRVRHFRPAVPYVNHLTVFVYIWLMFMPFTFLSSAGWFTVVWSLVVTYVVTMLYKIAHWLNKPLGDADDGRCTEFRSLCAAVAHEVLMEAAGRGDVDSLPIDKPGAAHMSSSVSSSLSSPSSSSVMFEEYAWLLSAKASEGASSPQQSANAVASFWAYVRESVTQGRTVEVVGMGVFTAWTLTVVGVVYGLPGTTAEVGARVWYIYLPLGNVALGYLGSIVSVMFGFWLQDAYARYRRSLELMTNEIVPFLRSWAYQFPVVVDRHSLHYGDHERFLSHLAVLPQTLALNTPPSSFPQMLSKRDAELLRDAPDPTTHALAVVASYMDAADAKFSNVPTAFAHTAPAALHLMQLFRPQFEAAVVELRSLQRFNIIHPLRSHLVTASAIFLTCLPIPAAVQNGLFAIPFVLPAVFCTLYLIQNGFQMDLPFGTRVDDIPMAMLCGQVREFVRDAYQQSVTAVDRKNGDGGDKDPRFPVHSDYRRENFLPKLASPPHTTSSSTPASVSQPRAKRSAYVLLLRLLRVVPKIPVHYLCCAIVWNTAVVCASYFIATALKGAGADTAAECRGWCNGIVLQGGLHWNVGRILFTILSFRAFDSLGRYDRGARTLGAVCANVGALGSDLVHAFAPGRFHPGDKERLIAHLVRLPLVLRDTLLSGDAVDSDSVNLSKHEAAVVAELSAKSEQTLLSDEDEAVVREAHDPLESLIHTLESYFLRAKREDEHDGVLGSTVSSEMTYVILPRMYELRRNISTLLTMKRYPFIRGYRFHQQVFLALWLAALPLTMVAQIGFFAILPSSLICFVALALETAISDLADPFGRSRMHDLDSMYDVPVSEICERTAADILDNCRATDWDIDGLVHTTKSPAVPALGSRITNSGHVYVEHKLPSLKRLDVSISLDVHAHTSGGDENSSDSHQSVEKHLAHSNPMKGNSMDEKPYAELHVREEFDTIHRRSERAEHKSMSKLLAYFFYSLPWGLIQTVALWSVLACFISYVTRNRTMDGTDKFRWWRTAFTIGDTPSLVISFLTFTLLAFYVNAAYNRYAVAAKVWHGELQWMLHTLTAEFKIYWASGAIHDNDQARLVGHLAALPYALRSDLRHSRDAREAMALLSPEDYVAMTAARSMAVHVVSVVRAYYTKVAMRSSTIDKARTPPKQGRLNLMFRIDIPILEQLVQTALHYRDYSLPPQFTALVNTWLVVWFLFLPFILVEFTGWLTIVWTTGISVSVLGLRQLAYEIVHPYGHDINDLDLDGFAHDIAADVISTYRTARPPSQTSHLPKPSWAPAANYDMLLDEEPSSSHCNSPVLSEETNTKPVLESDTSGYFTVPEDRMLSSSVASKSLGIAQIKLALSAMSAMEFLSVLMWSCFVVLLGYITSRYAPLPPGDAPCSPWFCTIVAADGRSMEYIGYGLFLLLSFRISDSHRRFTEAVRLWNDELVGTSYLFLTRFYSTFRPGMFHAGDTKRVGAHVQAFAIAVMTKLRDSETLTKALGQSHNLSDEDMRHIAQTEKMDDSVIDVIRGYLVDAERLPAERKQFSGNDLTRIFIHLRRLSRAAQECVAVKQLQIPVGFLLHLRMFILLWVIVLPFALVQKTGWTAMLWSAVIIYAVVGIEHWASELSDPFGIDMSDIAMEEYVNRVVDLVKWHDEHAGKIVDLAQLKEERSAFLAQVETVETVEWEKGSSDVV